jgi:predicted short-subunit dehydrogenase-like oxidoreductase (DUF2520 family)
MGQVPKQIPYGIAGDGKLARHFAHYFNLRKIPHARWSRRMQAEDGLTAVQALSDCETILVMISDAAIEPWIVEARAAGLITQRFVHFSGALATPMAIGLHPLMSFGMGFYELAEYERIPFITETGGATFPDVFPTLSNPSFSIPAEHKALYHALCVMSGNFTVLLWQKMFSDFEKKLGVPVEAALPYLERIARNLKSDPGAALTGPLARGDRQTIEKNLESLSGDRFQKIYESFVEAYSS